MPRRSRSDSRLDGPLFAGHRFSVMNAGVCLLALEWFRQLGLPCVSDADVLKLVGIDTSDPEVVEDVRLRLMFDAQAYFTAGMLRYLRTGSCT